MPPFDGGPNRQLSPQIWADKLGSTGMYGSSLDSIDAPDGAADEDVTFLLGLRERRPSVVAAFYARHQAGVRRLLLAELGPSDDLSDLIQEVFMSVLEHVGTLREPRALRAWLRSVTLFTARAHVRRAWRRKRLAVGSPDRVAEQKQQPPCFDARLALREVWHIVEDLPAQERQVFLFRILTGRKLTESAEACGVSVSTFKVRLSRAQRRFIKQVRRRPALVARLGAWFDEQPRTSAFTAPAHGSPRAALLERDPRRAQPRVHGVERDL